MAHVKVVRRSMRPEEWTDLRFGWLERGLILDSEEITDLRIRDARQISENEYVFDDPEDRPLRKGDLYFTPEPRLSADMSGFPSACTGRNSICISQRPLR